MEKPTNKMAGEATHPPGSGDRRSPTRFRDLHVPVGTKLAFTKNSHITCAVLDDANHVGYEGNLWTISALAERLLKVSSAQGFRFFSYEGETLWERRLRLEREGSAEAIHPPENFGQKLTVVVDTLAALEEKVSAANLEFALNLSYRVRFRKEYASEDNDTIMCV